MAELKPHTTLHGSMSNGWEDASDKEKLEYAISLKQDKLTAGLGISITEESVISVTQNATEAVDWDELLAHYNYYKK